MDMNHIVGQNTYMDILSTGCHFEIVTVIRPALSNMIKSIMVSKLQRVYTSLHLFYS